MLRMQVNLGGLHLSSPGQLINLRLEIGGLMETTADFPYDAFAVASVEHVGMQTGSSRAGADGTKAGGLGSVCPLIIFGKSGPTAPLQCINLSWFCGNG